MPPVDLWRWELQLLPLNADPGLAARAAGSDVIVRAVDQLPDTVPAGFRRLERPLTQPLLANPARISWAAKPLEILIADRLPTSDPADPSDPATTQPAATQPAAASPGQSHVIPPPPRSGPDDRQQSLPHPAAGAAAAARTPGRWYDWCHASARPPRVHHCNGDFVAAVHGYLRGVGEELYRTNGLVLRDGKHASSRGPRADTAWLAGTRATGRARTRGLLL
jgi:hypothetical protein